MTDGKTDRRQEIESLLAERSKYEGWLAQLETRREAAPAHVFQLVRDDYARRLDAVGAKLAAETGAIEELVRDLAQRLADEQRAVAAKSDERAEAELRASVGEYSEKEWAVRRRKLDDAIAELQRKSGDTERELTTLRNLLASVSGPGAPARPSQELAAIARVTGDLAIAGSEPQMVAGGEASADEAPPAPEASDEAAQEDDAVTDGVAAIESEATIVDVVTVEDASAIGEAGLV